MPSPSRRRKTRPPAEDAAARQRRLRDENMELSALCREKDGRLGELVDEPGVGEHGQDPGRAERPGWERRLGGRCRRGQEVERGMGGGARTCVDDRRGGGRTRTKRVRTRGRVTRDMNLFVSGSSPRFRFQVSSEARGLSDRPGVSRPPEMTSSTGRKYRLSWRRLDTSRNRRCRWGGRVYVRDGRAARIAGAGGDRLERRVHLPRGTAY